MSVAERYSSPENIRTINSVKSLVIFSENVIKIFGKKLAERCKLINDTITSFATVTLLGPVFLKLFRCPEREVKRRGEKHGRNDVGLVRDIISYAEPVTNVNMVRHSVGSYSRRLFIIRTTRLPSVSSLSVVWCWDWTTYLCRVCFSFCRSVTDRWR